MIHISWEQTDYTSVSSQCFSLVWVGAVGSTWDETTAWERPSALAVFASQSGGRCTWSCRDGGMRGRERVSLQNSKVSGGCNCTWNANWSASLFGNVRFVSDKLGRLTAIRGVAWVTMDCELRAYWWQWGIFWRELEGCVLLLALLSESVSLYVGFPNWTPCSQSELGW